MRSPLFSVITRVNFNSYSWKMIENNPKCYAQKYLRLLNIFFQDQPSTDQEIAYKNAWNTAQAEVQHCTLYSNSTVTQNCRIQTVLIALFCIASCLFSPIKSDRFTDNIKGRSLLRLQFSITMYIHDLYLFF
jgi:hypothetical protein